MTKRRRWTVGEQGARPVDVHVGFWVRVRRTMLGMSQMKLAESLGLTYQQIQNYEKGINRISASRLYELSRILDVSINYFFKESEAGGREDKSI